MNDCCSPYCSPQVDDTCVESTVPSVPELGIEQGSTLKHFNEAMVKQVVANKEAIAECSFCGGGGNTGDTTSSTIGDISKLSSLPITESSAPFKVNVNSSTNTSILDYDLTNAVRSVGAQAVNVSLYKSNSAGGTTTLGSSKSLSGGFNIQNSDFPVTLNVESRFGDINEERVATFSRTYLNMNQSLEQFLDVKVIGTNSIETQRSYNELLANKIVSLEDRLNSLLNLDISGTSDVRQVIIEQSNKIAELEATIRNISDIPVAFTDAETQTTKTIALSEALKTVDANSFANNTENKLLSDSVLSLQNKIDILGN